MFNLKLTKAPHFMQVENNEDAERRRLEQLELLSAVDDGHYHDVKITTNILDLRHDKKDERQLSSINGVKLIYKMANGGSLILIGNLGCSFRQPFGGEFFQIMSGTVSDTLAIYIINTSKTQKAFCAICNKKPFSWSE